jgi:hypothetical protein
MAENVSSNVLFHFTKTLNNLKSILKNGFFPHYCPEYTLDPADKNAASKNRPPMRAAPMVCFCDLPISLICKHLNEYGSFGIGLRKDWGLKNGLAPVIYTHPNAQTRAPILSLTAKAVKTVALTKDDPQVLAAYTKPFLGPAWKGKTVPDIHFYDEREWRYVPTVEPGEPLFLTVEEYENAATKDKAHRRLRRKFALTIHPDDIQYLILPVDKTENQIVELHRYLKRIYSPRNAVLVTTTIMTEDCILEDV